ncbi:MULTISPECIES: IPExxxVDY family protein [unclassified Leeuwenhoekiella]|uniref:IPExxxVDY family protein n=1 Tax=unclassified Leeuwenhoekiella TaxID=2615029 RepID=UPI00048A4600|nr:IPExxxVDY family protein [Leeuwenhoekiella sp. MAR_2009_132]
MAALKLLLDDTFEYDFALIAIHCSLEDYRIAFMLNKYAGLRLKSAKDINYYTKNDTYSFPTLQYDDVKNYVYYTLISNKHKFKDVSRVLNNDLFAESAGEHFKTFNLVPEVKNADYLLKIESDSGKVSIQNLVNQLNQISQIITAYDVNVSSLKSKQNLIFE